ncbi:MAG: hypothetical protein J0H25_15845 [Rhizobiales bacterium]|jgi:hypothetical protein|nr:hypothetical protein [Hyphomicrobiales bacterium]
MAAARTASPRSQTVRVLCRAAETRAIPDDSEHVTSKIYHTRHGSAPGECQTPVRGIDLFVCRCIEGVHLIRMAVAGHSTASFDQETAAKELRRASFCGFGRSHSRKGFPQ